MHKHHGLMKLQTRAGGSVTANHLQDVNSSDRFLMSQR